MYGRIIEESLRLEHRHSDGTWGRFQRVHHDPAGLDPERDWAKGKILYSCTSCDELVRVDDPSEPRGSEPQAG